MLDSKLSEEQKALINFQVGGWHTLLNFYETTVIAGGGTLEIFMETMKTVMQDFDAMINQEPKLSPERAKTVLLMKLKREFRDYLLGRGSQ